MKNNSYEIKRLEQELKDIPDGTTPFNLTLLNGDQYMLSSLTESGFSVKNIININNGTLCFINDSIPAQHSVEYYKFAELFANNERIPLYAILQPFDTSYRDLIKKYHSHLNSSINLIKLKNASCPGDKNRKGSSWLKTGLKIAGTFVVLVFLLFLLSSLFVQKEDASTQASVTTNNVDNNIPEILSKPIVPEANILERNVNLMVQSNPQRYATLLRGVKSGDYAFRLGSKNSNKPLFVFSDPTCPNCKAFESELTKLSESNTVWVFPVSVIGKVPQREYSAKMTAGVLCLPPDKRAAAWKEAISTNRPVTDNPCVNGTKALNENIAFFQSQKLYGTPTIMRGDGAIFNNITGTKSTTAENILAWANDDSFDESGKEDK